MKKKEKNPSTVKGNKKFLKIQFTNNNKNVQMKPKQRLNNSMDRKKNNSIYLSTDQNKNLIKERIQNNRIHLTKQRKDKTTLNNSSYTKSRSIKTNKVKEYENTLNKLNEDSINEREKENIFYSKLNKEKEKSRSNTYKREKAMRSKSNYIKPSKVNNSKNTKKDNNSKESKESSDESSEQNSDDSSVDEVRKEDDMLYRTLYRPSLARNSLLFGIERLKDKDKDKEKKDKDLSDSKENIMPHPISQFIMNSSNLNHNKKANNNAKKSSLYKNGNKTQIINESEDSREYRKKVDSYNDSTIYFTKSFGYLSNERVVDLYVIDTEGEEPIVSSRNKRKINKKTNIFKEIKIEKYDKFHPLRKEKLTGFVLIRKSKGKIVYDIELEDNIDKINEILKNKEIMIKNEIIQFITLKQINDYENDIKKNNAIISRLLNDLKQKDSSLEKIEDKDKDQISTLKAKIDELNKIIYNQQDELNQNIREFKQVKLAYDLLQDTLEKEKKEKEPTQEQLYKIKIKAQMQKEEENDKKAIKEIKTRIKKYKDELKKVPTNESSRRVSIVSLLPEESNLKGNKSPKRKYMTSKDVNEQNNNDDINPKPDSSEDDDAELNNFGDDEKDPKKRKMKDAVNRFKKKYHEVIKEEKRIKKQKEKEEREREENEEKELEDENYEYNREYLEQKEREERERREKEEKEREERERQRKEKEEKERKEKEERERRDRRDRERREGEERERKERAKKIKEEQKRKENEKKEKEKKIKEEQIRKENEKKDKGNKIKEEQIRKENEKKEKINGPGQNKMMGGNFAKMLANKLKNAPPGGKKVSYAPKFSSKICLPIIERNPDMAELLENNPLKGMKGRKKPTKKLFIEEE